MHSTVRTVEALDNAINILTDVRQEQLQLSVIGDAQQCSLFDILDELYTVPVEFWKKAILHAFREYGTGANLSVGFKPKHFGPFQVAVSPGHHGYYLVDKTLTPDNIRRQIAELEKRGFGVILILGRYGSSQRITYKGIQDIELSIVIVRNTPEAMRAVEELLRPHESVLSTDQAIEYMELWAKNGR